MLIATTIRWYSHGGGTFPNPKANETRTCLILQSLASPVRIFKRYRSGEYFPIQ